MHIKPVIIVDIDNTLISQDLRKKKIVSDLLQREITIEEIRKDFTVRYIFDKYVPNQEERNELINKFQEIFFGVGYFSFDTFELIQNANKVLHSINSLVDIYYLSARTNTLYEETRQQLEHFGFPIVDEEKNKLFLLNEEESLNLYGFANISQNYKSRLIKEIVNERNIIAAIGDTSDDICAFHNNGILSILFKNYYNEEDVIDKLKEQEKEIDYYSFIELKKWSDIESYLRSILQEGNLLKEIRERDISDYSKWLFDLDHKAMLLLVVGTFCGTTIFNLLTNERMQSLGIVFNTLALLGLIFSILSILLSIRSFGSKRTRGVNSSQNFSIRDAVANYKQSLKHLFLIILGQRVTPPHSPVEDKVQVYNSNFKKFAYLKHYNRLYGTIDGEDIETIKFFDIKSANYSKIYPETYARVFIFCTLTIIFIMAIMYFFTNINVGKLDLQTRSTQHLKAYSSQDSYHETPYLITSDYFDPSLTKVTEQGKKRLNEYYNLVKEKEKRFILAFTSIQTESEIEQNINQLKIKIQEELIIHTLKEIDPSIEIIIIDTTTSVNK